MVRQNFLLVGNGAREHAIAATVCKNKNVRFFAYMDAKNPGIAALCELSGGEYAIGNICNAAEIAEYAKSRDISLAFSSPDATLEAGVSDALIQRGVTCASPTRAASQIEWDKSFARDLMQRYSIPGNPKFKVCTTTEEAFSFIDSLGGNVAVKPSGLTGGKGVKVVGVQLNGPEDAKAYVQEIFDKEIGGIKSVIIEQKLSGEEFTLQAFSDGITLYPMPLVQDHKLAFEGDTGPNTGGMGSYSDSNHLLPFISKEEYEYAVSIMQKTIQALRSEKNSFVGVLYGQFMATPTTINLVEFNARFGDPEALNVLAVLNGDLYSIFESMAHGKLQNTAFSFEKKATVCKYLVPKGYPEKSESDQPIRIDWNCVYNTGAKLYFASVYEKDNIIYTRKSRSIGVLAVADSIAKAEKSAEWACSCVSGPLRHRADIGTQELINKKIARMNRLRSLKEESI
ncbi:MAG: phosphoribosylamine--glycine ligase [Candidatus Anstonellales archaeon]